MSSLSIILFVALFCAVTSSPPEVRGEYQWTNVTAAADYPQGYGYPVFVWGDKMVAFNNGTWISRDGKSWKKAPLPDSGLNSAYLKHVQFNGAIYALGSMTGNYEGFTISTKIIRTRDLEKWETVAERSELPKRIFYGVAVFDNKIWLAGGYDGKNYHNGVWNSTDGVTWKRVTDNAPWSARNTRLIVFQDKLWLLGGGVIDGHRDPNPKSGDEMWTSPDGKSWSKVDAKPQGRTGGTPIVFDGKLWMIGGNRNDGKFGNAYSVSSDGINWQAHSAPWTPRGAVAVWEFGGRLLMTGGKYSHTENGEIKFVYSNDVWAMERKSE